MDELKTKYDVFISYSRKDTEIADKICQVFDKVGITYFIDRQGIGGGMEFPAVLAKAIKEATVFLFLASKNSYESKFTQSEIIYAFNKKQKQDIIPYIIDGSTMPDELEFTFSAINWRRMDSHPIDTVLVNDILSKVGKQRKIGDENGLPKDSGSNDDKHKKANTYAKLIEKYFTNSDFSGKHLAWIVLAYSILLFIVMAILSKNYIQTHYSTVENVVMISIVTFLLFTVVGIVRPASIALHNRKEVLKFYLSSAIISFASLFFLTGNKNVMKSSDNEIQQLDSIRNANEQGLPSLHFENGAYFYKGTFVDEDQIPYPVEIQFMYSNGQISDCIYHNVTIKGKLKMEGAIINDSLRLKGKAGSHDFSIVLGCKDTSQYLEGYALDEEKRLEVSLKSTLPSNKDK